MQDAGSDGLDGSEGLDMHWIEHGCDRACEKANLRGATLAVLKSWSLCSRWVNMEMTAINHTNSIFEEGVEYGS